MGSGPARLGPCPLLRCPAEHWAARIWEIPLSRSCSRACRHSSTFPSTSTAGVPGRSRGGEGAPSLRAEAGSPNFVLGSRGRTGLAGVFAWGPGDLRESPGCVPQPHPTQLKLRLRRLPGSIPPSPGLRPPPGSTPLTRGLHPSPSYPTRAAAPDTTLGPDSRPNPFSLRCWGNTDRIAAAAGHPPTTGTHNTRTPTAIHSRLSSLGLQHPGRAQCWQGGRGKRLVGGNRVAFRLELSKLNQRPLCALIHRSSCSAWDRRPRVLHQASGPVPDPGVHQGGRGEETCQCGLRPLPAGV